jgi:phage I-like protein
MKLRELPKTVNAGDEADVQLAPLGDWTQTIADKDGKPKEITQRFDAAACSKVVENFSGELLVDADHRSTKPDGDTSAYAWVTGLRNDPELGLVGTLKFTDKGAAAVNGREYRFVSVCWFLGDDGRPFRLDSVALTNRPNLPVRPVLNRRAANANPAAEGGKPERNPAMDKLKEILGLAPDAADEAVVAAVTGLKGRLDAAEAQAKDAEAEQFAAENSAKCDKDVLKDAYLKSPEVAKALVANMKAQEPPKAPLPDFSKAKTPAPIANAKAATTPPEVYNHYMAMAEGPEKDAYLAANAQAISDGYEAVHNVK